MFSLLIWCIYGIFVGSIAKSIVPGEENLGFFQTIILGVIGSYMGGAICYLLGKYSAVEPAGIVMGVVGAVLGIVLYKKLSNNN